MRSAETEKRRTCRTVGGTSRTAVALRTDDWARTGAGIRARQSSTGIKDGNDAIEAARRRVVSDIAVFNRRTPSNIPRPAAAARNLRVCRGLDRCLRSAHRSTSCIPPRNRAACYEETYSYFAAGTSDGKSVAEYSAASAGKVECGARHRHLPRTHSARSEPGIWRRAPRYFT